MQKYHHVAAGGRQRGPFVINRQIYCCFCFCFVCMEAKCAVHFMIFSAIASFYWKEKLIHKGKPKVVRFCPPEWEAFVK